MSVPVIVDASGHVTLQLPECSSLNIGRTANPISHRWHQATAVDRPSMAVVDARPCQGSRCLRWRNLLRRESLGPNQGLSSKAFRIGGGTAQELQRGGG